MSKANLETWHQRLGHANIDAVKRLSHHSNGMKILDNEFSKCSVCIKAKMAKRPFKPSTRRSTKVLELVHSDIAGPMRTPTIFNGHRYVINFIDDYSHHTVVYTMKQKSEALTKMQQYIVEIDLVFLIVN
jgi:hypothetical protein